MARKLGGIHITIRSTGPENKQLDMPSEMELLLRVSLYLLIILPLPLSFTMLK